MSEPRQTERQMFQSCLTATRERSNLFWLGLLRLRQLTDTRNDGLIKAVSMRLLLNNILILFISLTRPLNVFANGDGDHPSGTPHTEAASIDPTMVIGIVIFLVIGGFVVWKFVLSSPKSSLPTQSSQPEKTTPAQEKSVSQSGEGEGSQKS